MTNFATFIATGNNRAPIAQRGKAKQKRSRGKSGLTAIAALPHPAV